MSRSSDELGLKDLGKKSAKTSSDILTLSNKLLAKMEEVERFFVAKNIPLDQLRKSTLPWQDLKVQIADKRIAVESIQDIYNDAYLRAGSPKELNKIGFLETCESLQNLHRTLTNLHEEQLSDALFDTLSAYAATYAQQEEESAVKFVLKKYDESEIKKYASPLDFFLRSPIHPQTPGGKDFDSIDLELLQFRAKYNAISEIRAALDSHEFEGFVQKMIEHHQVLSTHKSALKHLPSLFTQTVVISKGEDFYQKCAALLPDQLKNLSSSNDYASFQKNARSSKP